MKLDGESFERGFGPWLGVFLIGYLLDALAYDLISATVYFEK